MSATDLTQALQQWGIEVACTTDSNSPAVTGGYSGRRLRSSDIESKGSSSGGGGGSGLEGSDDEGKSEESESMSLKGTQANPSGGGSGSSEAEEGSDGQDDGTQDCSNELVYMTAVGTMNNCLGGASLYVSTDTLRCVL